MTTANKPELEIIVLCEGYQDRAFIAGLAEQMGWPWPRRNAASQVDARDLDGRLVRGSGKFYFLQETAEFRRGLLLQPCAAEMTGGQVAQQVEGALLSHLRDIASGTMVARRRCMFWCVDADTRAGEPVEARAKSERSRLLNLIQREGIYASLAPDGRIWLDGTTACALPLVWHTDDRSGMKGVPDKQTLERLVCAAMAAAYQDRAAHVQDWLDNRPPEDDLPAEGARRRVPRRERPDRGHDRPTPAEVDAIARR